MTQLSSLILLVLVLLLLSLTAASLCLSASNAQLSKREGHRQEHAHGQRQKPCLHYGTVQKGLKRWLGEQKTGTEGVNPFICKAVLLAFFKFLKPSDKTKRRPPPAI